MTPQKLELMNASVDAWCQVACPRLSIDWGEAFTVRLLFRADAVCPCSAGLAAAPVALMLG